jgi:putative membrane protein
MTIEAEPERDRLRPRISQTGETGRLDLAMPPPEVTLPALQPGRSRSPFAVAMAGFGILALTVFAIDLVQFVDGAFAHGTGLGVATVVAVAAACGGAVYWLMAELRGLWRLRSTERLRSLIPSALSSELKNEVNAAAIVLGRDPLLGVAVGRYRAILEPHHSGRDTLELFSRFVLAPADRLAEAAIRRAAAQAFAINAISPTALLDTLLFAARALRLVREIAEVYGQRPGLAGTVHLIRRLAGGAGLVGAVDLAGGLLVQQLGGAVVERLSAGAAESTYAAQKMARLGIIAMALCRPVEFGPGEAPSLRRLVTGLLRPHVAENQVCPDQTSSSRSSGE